MGGVFLFSVFIFLGLSMYSAGWVIVLLCVFDVLGLLCDADADADADGVV